MDISKMKEELAVLKADKKELEAVYKQTSNQMHKFILCRQLLVNLRRQQYLRWWMAEGFAEELLKEEAA